MCASCGLKLETQRNRKSKFIATHPSVFGGTSSPFILNSTILHHLSKIEKGVVQFVQFVAQDLQEKLYCDDVLTGTDNEDTAILYYKLSRQIMSGADMNLRQWFTNLSALRAVIDKAGTGSQRDQSDLLGMVWNPRKDTLQFPQKALVGLANFK